MGHRRTMIILKRISKLFYVVAVTRHRGNSVPPIQQQRPISYGAQKNYDNTEMHIKVILRRGGRSEQEILSRHRGNAMIRSVPR